MSTFLQRAYFAEHPEIYFLGASIVDSEHGWISDEVASLAEVELRCAKDFVYDPEAAEACLKPHFEAFEADESKKILCFSSESMSFTMLDDIDVVQKAKRLHALFGPDTKVLMVIRNQIDLLRSFYYECVRSGYSGYFSEFIEYLYFHQYRSIVTDLFYDKMYDLYVSLFGSDNVIVVPMESLVKDKCLDKLSNILEISSIDLDMTPMNSSNNKKYIQAVRLLNEKFPNNMGASQFSMVNTLMLEAYWKVELGLQPPSSAKKSFGQRMMIYRAANETFKDFVNPLDARYGRNWKKRLKQYYEENNKRLQEKSGVSLQGLKFPLPCVEG